MLVWKEKKSLCLMLHPAKKCLLTKTKSEKKSQNRLSKKEKTITVEVRIKKYLKQTKLKKKQFQPKPSINDYIYLVGKFTESLEVSREKRYVISMFTANIR